MHSTQIKPGPLFGFDRFLVSTARPRMHLTVDWTGSTAVGDDGVDRAEVLAGEGSGGFMQRPVKLGQPCATSHVAGRWTSWSSQQPAQRRAAKIALDRYNCNLQYTCTTHGPTQKHRPRRQRRLKLLRGHSSLFPTPPRNLDAASRRASPSREGENRSVAIDSRVTHDSEILGFFGNF